MTILTSAIRSRFSSLFLILCSFFLWLAHGQVPASNIRIIAPTNIYAGDMVYMGLVVNEPAGTPYSVESVSMGSYALDHELHCRINMCPKDAFGKYGTTVEDEVTLGARVPALAPGTYTFTLTMKVNGVVKVETRPLVVHPQPVAPPPPPAIVGTPAPGIEKWESTMLALGAKWCPGPNQIVFGDYSQVWYYDGARVYFQLADYTGDKRWETCAFNIARQYRDLAISRDGNVLGWAVFPHGLRMAYERTGDPSYKQAIDLMSTKSGWAFWLLGADDWYIREISYIVNTHVEAERLGAPRHPNLARRIDYLLAHFDRIFVANTYTIHQTAYDAMAAEALIYYYELTKDPRVPPAIKTMLDWTWDYGWNKSTNQLIYNPDPWGPKCATLCGEYTTDMVNLTVPAFAWYWNLTGDSLYQYRGDELFKHALDSDISYSGKIFSQNYKWSFEYLRWRKATRGEASCAYTISPAGASVGAAGGTVALQVAAGAVCPWAADSGAGWAAISGGASGTGAGAVNVTVAANSATTERTATLTIAGQAVTLTQAAAACTYAVSASTASVAAAGGTVALAVTAGAGCSWTAGSPVDWAQVATNADTVNVTVAANSATKERTATLTIAGQVVTLTQAAAPCTYAVSASTASVAAAGGTVALAVTAGAGCSWTAGSPVDWAQIATSAGAVNVTVAANSATTERTATLTIAGQVVTVTQAAAPCTYAVSASTASVAAAGGTVALAVTAGAGCSWTAGSPVDWAQIATSAGAVNVTVAANSATTERTATLTIAGQAVTLTQAAAPCAYSVSSMAEWVPAVGGTVVLAVKAGAGCSWTAGSSVDWLRVVTSSGIVSVTVPANTETSERSAVLFIGNKAVTLTQAGAAVPPPADLPCTYKATPSAISVGKGEGQQTQTFSVLVTASASSCEWTADIGTTWLALRGVVNHTGSRVVTYRVEPNKGAARWASLKIAGLNVTVVQN